MGSFQNYLITWYQHVGRVQEEFINSLNHPEFKLLPFSLATIPLTPSIQYTYFPLVWCSLYGFRSLVYIGVTLNLARAMSSISQLVLVPWLVELCMRAGRKYSQSSALNIQMCILVWTIHYVLVTIKDFGLRLVDLKFLLVYSLNGDGSEVRPWDMGLTSSSYARFIRFRFWIVRMLNTCIVGITVVCALCEGLLSWDTGEFDEYPVYAFISWVAIIYWTLHGCQG